MKKSEKILINTIAQYTRTIANTLLALLSTRYVLDAIGVKDYGIYTLVAGIISLLSFLANTQTTTTQRFISYNESKNDIIIQRKFFVNSLCVQIVIGVIMMIIFACIEPLLFDGFLNIDQDRISSAKIVYIFVIFMLFISLISAPYRAVLIAHENIIYTSTVDIIDGVLKLIIGYSLYFFNSERLIWYSVLSTGISMFNLLAFFTFCRLKFSECKQLSLNLIDKKIIKETTTFAGWTAYGTFCLFGRVQGTSIIINKFFSTAVNAGYGIALTVNSALQSISAALNTAISPQLTKAEGAHNRETMIAMSEFGCKLNFILISSIGIPIIFNINFILSLWLQEIPPYAPFFCCVLIASNIADQLSTGFGVAINAIGKIKNYNIIVNTLKFATVAVIGVLLALNVNIHYAFSAYFVIEAICSFIRVICCFRLVKIKMVNYFKNVLFRLLPSTVFLIGLFWIFSSYTENIAFLIIEVIIFSLCYYVMIYFTALSLAEKKIINNILFRITSKK